MVAWIGAGSGDKAGGLKQATGVGDGLDMGVKGRSESRVSSRLFTGSLG